MSKKKKKKGNKNMTDNEKKIHEEVVDAIKKSSAVVPLNKGTQTQFPHAKSCMCSDCSKGSLQQQSLDHGVNCVCWKCKNNKGLGYTGKSSNTTSYSYTPCHEGNVHVFTHQGISVYGGGNLKDPEPNKVDIVLDLDRNVHTASWENDLPEDWSCRNQSTSKTKVLDLYIKDMYAPEHVDAGFWKLFWNDLRKEAHKNGGKLSILVMCQGGHGRTGVVLASLIMASAYNKVGIPEDVHPVTWLRDNYCDKAVESQRQCDYLKRLWNMRFIEATKGGKTSFSKGPAGLTSTSNGKDTGPEDNEVPTADTKCQTCQTKRTSTNRVLFSGDLEEFECDNCFGIRADQIEKDEGKVDEILKLEDARTDMITECGGSECFEQYDPGTEMWTSTHTYTKGCNKKGESFDDIPINEMTNAQYDVWAKSMI